MLTIPLKEISSIRIAKYMQTGSMLDILLACFFCVLNIVNYSILKNVVYLLGLKHFLFLSTSLEIVVILL